MPELNINFAKDPDEKRAIQFANGAYQQYETGKSRGMDDHEALKNAMFGAAAAASALLGPYGPVVVLAIKAIFDALPQASGSVAKPGEPYYFTSMVSGITQTGLWYGPMLLMYRENPPDWMEAPSPMYWVRRPEVPDGAKGFWNHLKAHVSPETWSKSFWAANAAFELPVAPGAKWGMPDWPRIMSALLIEFPYKPVNKKVEGTSIMLAPPPEPKALIGALKKLGGSGAIGGGSPIGSTGILGEQNKAESSAVPLILVAAIGLGAILLIGRR